MNLQNIAAICKYFSGEAKSRDITKIRKSGAEGKLMMYRALHKFMMYRALHKFMM